MIADGANAMLNGFKLMEIEDVILPPRLPRRPSHEELLRNQDLIEWSGTTEDSFEDSPSIKYIKLTSTFIHHHVIFISSSYPDSESGFVEMKYWHFSPSAGLYQVELRKHQGAMGWYPVDRIRRQSRIPCEKVIQVIGDISMAYNLIPNDKK